MLKTFYCGHEYGCVVRRHLLGLSANQIGDRHLSHGGRVTAPKQIDKEMLARLKHVYEAAA